jgi:hypothetical protein
MATVDIGAARPRRQFGRGVGEGLVTIAAFGLASFR